jgi:hypothetical protein
MKKKQKIDVIGIGTVPIRIRQMKCVIILRILNKFHEKK